MPPSVTIASPRALRRAGAASALALVLGACGGERIPLSSVEPPTVRVLLGVPKEGATLVIPDAWEATSFGGRSWSSRGTNLSAPLSVGPSGVMLGTTSTGSTALRVRPVGAFRLDMDGDRRAYRGTLVLRASQGRLELVNEVDLETYVAGVIGNEIGFDQAAAALQAQAVAARTYGYVRVRASPDAEWHLHDDTRSQVYKGVTVPQGAPVGWSHLERYAAETRGVVLTWKGEPFPAYYFSTCGGHTTKAELGGLDPAGASVVFRGVPCAYCGSSKYFAWAETVTMERLLDALKPRGVGSPITHLDWKTGEGGWVTEVLVTHGPKGAVKRVPGRDFRAAAGLRSAKFTAVEPQSDGTLLFRGAGWGHGVGLCQVGAQEMARRGFAPDQILRYYYPGAEFTRLY